jgi:hypothetical protein
MNHTLGYALILLPLAILVVSWVAGRISLRRHRRARAKNLEAYHRACGIVEIRRGASGHPAFHDRRRLDRVRH